MRKPLPARAAARSSTRRRCGDRQHGGRRDGDAPPAESMRGCQTLRLDVHVSAGGANVSVRLSNIFGDRPLVVGAAHVARRTKAADVDPSLDRTLTFRGQAGATLPPRSTVATDPVDLDAPPLSDLAICLFLPEQTDATTTHLLALQTSYVSTAGDATAAGSFPVAKTISTWPFLAGVDVEAPAGAASIVAFGSSTTDGDGATKDANRRWPDVLAARLHTGAVRGAELSVSAIVCCTTARTLPIIRTARRSARPASRDSSATCSRSRASATS